MLALDGSSVRWDTAGSDKVEVHESEKSTQATSLPAPPNLVPAGDCLLLPLFEEAHTLLDHEICAVAMFIMLLEACPVPFLPSHQVSYPCPPACRWLLKLGPGFSLLSETFKWYWIHSGHHGTMCLRNNCLGVLHVRLACAPQGTRNGMTPINLFCGFLYSPPPPRFIVFLIPCISRPKQDAFCTPLNH